MKYQPLAQFKLCAIASPWPRKGAMAASSLTGESIAASAVALFDDGGQYTVSIIQPAITWTALLATPAFEGQESVTQQLAARAGGLQLAGQTRWCAVLYINYGNFEWIPETWLKQYGSAPSSYFAAWRSLWDVHMTTFHSKHFLPAAAAPHASAPRLSQRLKRRPRDVPAKYWVQRRTLWSRWDHGIAMDGVGWYSVTPEHAARQIAELAGRMSWPKSPAMVQAAAANSQRGVPGLIVDAFAGVGGNAIQFALHCCTLGGGPPSCPLGKIVAIDSDAKRLRHLQHNARIYGLNSQLMGEGNAHAAEQCDDASIVCLAGDSMRLLRDGGALLKGTLQPLLDTTVHIGAVFLAPPWGGEFYASKQPSLASIRVVDAHGQQCDGRDIFWAAAGAANIVMYYLPRQYDLRAVMEELSGAPAASRALPPVVQFDGHLPKAGTVHAPIQNAAGKIIAALLVVKWDESEVLMHYQKPPSCDAASKQNESGLKQ